MTRKINRYTVKEIQSLRFRKKGSTRTIEISSREDLEKGELALIFSIEDEDRMKNFLKALESIRESHDIELELDFEEPLDR